MKPAKPKRVGSRRRSTGRAAAARTDRVRSVADAAEAASEATSEVTTETRQAAEAVNATQAQTVDAATRLSRTALDAWTESGVILARGAEDIGRAWLRFTQQSMAEGTAAARAILGAKTLREAVDLQNDYARNSLGTFVAESARLSELSVKVAREAMVPLTARLEAASERISR